MFEMSRKQILICFAKQNQEKNILFQAEKHGNLRIYFVFPRNQGIFISGTARNAKTASQKCCNWRSKNLRRKDNMSSSYEDKENKWLKKETGEYDEYKCHVICFLKFHRLLEIRQLLLVHISSVDTMHQ